MSIFLLNRSNLGLSAVVRGPGCGGGGIPIKIACDRSDSLTRVILSDRRPGIRSFKSLLVTFWALKIEKFKHWC